MGSHYGALPVHDALWHSAEATAHIAARAPGGGALRA